MRAIGIAIVASVALVGAYLALGGASYAPAKSVDPCVQRDWTSPQGVQEVGQQIVLSALDGAACKLGVSREQVVLAFQNAETRRAFAREHGIDEDELGDLVRTGLIRAVDDAEQAGAINGTTAALLGGLARRVPVEQFLDLLDLLPGS